MAGFEMGDIVVMTSGSMRMAVEAVDGENVAVIWCHEGEIGRESLNAKLLKKWEYREDDRGGARHGGGKPHRGDREGGGKPYRGGDRDDKPRGKPGWDGKPREKKYFRKD